MAVTIRPTLVIGFGTSGARIAEGVQQRMYEVFRVSGVPIFQLLAVETDSAYTRTKPPRTIESHSDNLTLLKLSTGGRGDFDNFEHLLRQLSDQGVKPDWVSPETARRLRAQGNGARGARVAGRLILWAHLSEVRRTLHDILDRAASDRSIEETRKILSSRFPGADISIEKQPLIVVCGTTTGGTFSGGAIDVGYLCRTQFEVLREEDLYAVMLLPPQRKIKEADAQKKANAYASLVETEYFFDRRVSYKPTWPGARPTEGALPEPPFGYVYYVSQDYGSYAHPIKGLDGLYQLSSLKIFADLIGLEQARAGGLADHLEHFPQSRYFSFGLAAVLHPRYQLSEHAGCELARHLLDRLLNQSEYRDTTDTLRAIPSPGRLSDRAKRRWEGLDGNQSLLDQAMRRLESPEAMDKSPWVLTEVLVEDLKEGRDYLQESFRTPGATLYGSIREKLDSTRDWLAKQIRTLVYRDLEQTQNLNHARRFAEGWVEVIEETRTFWSRLGVPSDEDGWAAYTESRFPRIRAAAGDPSENFKNLLFSRTEICEGLVLELVEDLKMYLVGRELEGVQEDIRALVDQLGTYETMLQRAQDILRSRQKEVRSQLGDHTIPLARVWSRGTLQGDLERLRAQFPNPGARDIADRYEPTRSPPSTWIRDTLRHWHQEDDVLEGAADETKGTYPAEFLKQAYQQRILQNIEEILPVNLKDRNYDEQMEYFKRVRRGNLRFDDHGVPSVVQKSTFLLGAPDVTTARRGDISSELSSFEFRELELPGMDHGLIFYHDRYLQNASQLKEFEEWRDHFENPNPAAISDTDDWRERREAYGAIGRLRRARLEEDLRHLFSLIGDLFVRWREDERGVWQPVSIHNNVDIPIAVGLEEAATRGEARKVVTWKVQSDLRRDEDFTILTPEESENDALNSLLEDPDIRVPEAVLSKGLRYLRELGLEELRDLWRRALEDGSLDRHEDQVRKRRMVEYFGADDDTTRGIVHRLISRDDPAASGTGVPS